MPTDLQEALNAAGAAALIQKRIDPVLLEYQRRYSPLVRTLPTVQWNSNIYYFNQRTTYVQGGPVQDGGARPVGQSIYVQNQFTIRNFQEIGSVTGYAQAVTADLIGNLRATEIEGAARGLSWDIETALTWGNSGSTVFGPYPQFTGFDVLAANYSGTTTNAINYGGVPLDLGVLDQIIDLVETNVGEPVDGGANWMFVMSPTANSRLAQLFTNQQRFIAPPIGRIETDAGLVVATYRDVPIIKSSFLNARTTQMTPISTSHVNTGGTLAAGTYYYQVSAVVGRSGESLPCAAVSVTVTTATGIVTLSFTPPTGYEGGMIWHYKVFRGTSSSNCTLLGYVDAAVALNSTGVSPIVTNQIVDNGTTLIAQNSVGPTQPGTYPAAYVNRNATVIPLSGGDQNIYLLSKDPNYVVRPYVRDMTIVDLYPNTTSPDALPFGMVSDTTLALRASRFIGRASGINVALAS
jgi:hypothetical protein